MGQASENLWIWRCTIGFGTDVVQKEFGIGSQALDDTIFSVLTDFIRNAEADCVKEGINSFQERLNALQDRTVVSSSGNDYEEFFGHTPPEFYDAMGNVIKTQ